MTIRRRAAAALVLALAAGELAAQETQIRGFTDVVATASDRSAESSAFGLGQFDLYIMSALADRWSFLGETVFEYDDGFIVDVERVIITYRPSSHVQLAIGKHHTPLGYWNNAYHHGALLQPTIARPEMFRFEDEGGILPIHTTGLLVAGRDLTSAHVGFDLMVGNGIGGTPVSDNNPAKSLTLALHSRITSRLTVGASYYQDEVAAGTPNLADPPTPLAAAMTQRMVGGFAVYSGSVMEAKAEYQHVANEGTAGGAGTVGTNALYAYAGYRIGKVVLYGRYDRIETEAGDPYFTAGERQMVVLGSRYDFGPTVVGKVEYHRRDFAGVATNEGQLQVAIGF